MGDVVGIVRSQDNKTLKCNLNNSFRELNKPPTPAPPKSLQTANPIPPDSEPDWMIAFVAMKHVL